MPDENLFATLGESLRQTQATRARRAARLAELEMEADKLRVEIAEMDTYAAQTQSTMFRIASSMIGTRPAAPTDRDIEAALQQDAERERANALNASSPNVYKSSAYPNQFAEHYERAPHVEKMPRVEPPPLRTGVETTSDRFSDRTIPQATTMILREEGRSLHVNELYNRLLEGGFNFTGQNPTISIAVSLNRNRRFRKVAPGTFDLTIRDVAQVS